MSSFNTVNQYCLDHIVDLSDTKDVIAAEDIFDDRGVLLWARGGRVSRELQEKLLKRKLLQPLETTLSVDDAVSFESVVDDAMALLGTDPLLDKLAGGHGALSMLRDMRNVTLPPSVSLLLTASRERQRKAFDHNLYAVLISLGIGSRLKMSFADTQTLMLAALLHDLGEMYINPEYLNSQQRLSPQDWKYVAAHPLIGRMLIQELTKLPTAVGECVAIHHERLDGSGYPNHIGRSRPNRLGAWLAVADSVAAIVARGGAGCASRVGMALRIVPEEFDRDAVSAVLNAMRDSQEQASAADTGGCIERANKAMQRIDRALAAAAAAATMTKDSFTRQSASEVANMLGNVRKSIHATGVLDSAQLGGLIDDPHVQTEIVQVIKEVEWRLRNMARNIYLRADKQKDGVSLQALTGVIEALDLET